MRASLVLSNVTMSRLIKLIRKLFCQLTKILASSVKFHNKNDSKRKYHCNHRVTWWTATKQQYCCSCADVSAAEWCHHIWKTDPRTDITDTSVLTKLVASLVCIVNYHIYNLYLQKHFKTLYCSVIFFTYFHLHSSSHPLLRSDISNFCFTLQPVLKRF